MTLHVALVVLRAVLVAAAILFTAATRRLIATSPTSRVGGFVQASQSPQARLRPRSFAQVIDGTC